MSVHDERKAREVRKEVLGFAHPIEINLFEKFHAHSDPLELDTNVREFVPECELFINSHPGPKAPA